MRSFSAFVRVVLLVLFAVTLTTLAPAQSAQLNRSSVPVAAQLTVPGSQARVPIMLGVSAHPNLAAAPDASAPQTAAPQFSVAPGAYSGPQTVTITSSTPNAVIYYTTNGYTPSTGSPVYSGPVPISRSGTLAAIAVAPGYSASPMTFGPYYITSVPDNFIYNVAGSNLEGLTGDGALATEAAVNLPRGVALDQSGDLFIADSENNVVREVNASTGIISTIAGTGVAGYSGDNGPATSAQLSAPQALAFDSHGDLYIADFSNALIRKITMSTGTITTYAGSQSATSAGFGGPATSAQLGGLWAIAFDQADNLYLTDNNRICEVDAKTQTLTVVAGGAALGYNQWGDGGPATSAALDGPQGLALDSAANIYIADTSNGAVRKVTRSTGIINTIAGTLGTNYRYGGDGGPATSAYLNWPTAIVVDSQGNLYISDSLNFRIRRVDAASGIINTVAGNGSPCTSLELDGSPATSAAVCEPDGFAFDSNGNLYYSDPGVSRVEMMTPLITPPSTPTAAPAFSVAAGTYDAPQTLTLSDPTPGATIHVEINPAPTAQPSPSTTSESYFGPINIVGNMTISAIAVAPGHIPSAPVSATYTITTPPNSVVSTVAGNGTSGFSGAGGPATSAELGGPGAITLDSYGNLYIADCGGLASVVWKATTDGNISILAGTGASGYSGDGGPATSATLRCPQGVAVDASGNVFISDNGNNRVREVLASTGNIVTYAGNGTSIAPNGDGGPATSASVGQPTALALDSKGNLYIITDYLVREVNAQTGIIETVAGSIYPPYVGIGDGGPATSASLFSPEGIAFDATDNLYIADDSHGRVRMVNAQTGIITTVAGNGDEGETGDGLPATQAELSPQAVVVDKQGNLFISNFGREIRKVDGKTGIISAAVGMNYPGSSGDGGSPLAATLCASTALALDPSGSLYFGDSCGASVRKVVFTAPAPAPTFDPPAGPYTGPQSVTISDTAPNATIYYTTDGSTPTNTSTQYSGAISVTANETINAIAVSSGYATSPAGSAAYTITPATPTITWATPAAITYGTALSATQLDASTTAPGTFTYSPAAGAILSAGQQTLTATFTPAANSGYASTTASVTLTVNKATPTPALTASANPAFVSNAVTFTAALTSSAGSPTGTVAFLDGTTQLGTATLASGSAAFTTSSLAVGTHTITAQYSGDANFAAVTSSAVSEIIADFTVAPPTGSSTTATVNPGGTANYTLAVNPPSGTTTPTAVAFTITGLPTGATDTFNPNPVPAGSGPTNVTLSITVPSTAAVVPASTARFPLAFALILLPFFGLNRRLRKRATWLFAILLLAAGSTVLTSCGGGSSNGGGGGGGGGQQPQTYTLTVTATAGSLTHTATLTLTVQ